MSTKPNDGGAAFPTEIQSLALAELRRNNQILQRTLDGMDSPNASLAMENARLRVERDRLDAVVKAARCIRHWHDSMDDGMVVSKEHVFALWDALKDLDEREKGQSDE